MTGYHWDGVTTERLPSNYNVHGVCHVDIVRLILCSRSGCTLHVV
eukprot:COSAG01_NODE_2045_length_8561_cov_6.449421_11_plen_45_part_00